MCGIIGYVGGSQALPVLMDGLRRLEYRGYDSAGIALITPEGRLDAYRSAGKLANLARVVDSAKPMGSAGIGHTRWATHGRPTTENAHPHIDCTGRICVVHNGIIENFTTLRRGLMERGHRFTTDVDSEVLTHLIEEEWGRLEQLGESSHGSRLLPAVRAALSQVRGAYAIGVMCLDEPQTIVAARLNAPLIVGIGDGENYLASDIPALLHRTKSIIRLGEGQLALIRPANVSVWDLAGTRIEAVPVEITWEQSAAEKGGYPHFVLKEIHEQPEALRAAMRGRISDTGGCSLS